MLFVEDAKLAHAAEALVIAARTVTDADGLRVAPRMPTLSRPATLPGSPLLDDTDWTRIRAVALGAIVALLGASAAPASENNLQE